MLFIKKNCRAHRHVGPSCQQISFNPSSSSPSCRDTWRSPVTAPMPPWSLMTTTLPRTIIRNRERFDAGNPASLSTLPCGSGVKLSIFRQDAGQCIPGWVWLRTNYQSRRSPPAGLLSCRSPSSSCRHHNKMARLNHDCPLVVSASAEFAAAFTARGCGGTPPPLPSVAVKRKWERKREKGESGRRKNEGSMTCEPHNIFFL